jgi:DNA-binding NtrC family response regulator
MASILVVDDEVGIRELLSEILGDEGHSVLTAENAARARDVRSREHIDLVLLDIWMPDTDGVTLLKEWAAGGQLTMPVIMMSGHATIDTAVEATRYGALEFLEKPIAMARLLSAVRSGLERGRVMRSLRPPPGASDAAPVTEAPATRAAETPAVAEADATQNGIPLDQPLREARDQFERVYFEFHLARENYSMTRVADRAGLERTHLYRKLKQLGIELARGARRDRALEEAIAAAAAPAPSPAPQRQSPVYVQRDDYDD